jgi:hypothetical protein
MKSNMKGTEEGVCVCNRKREREGDRVGDRKCQGGREREIG